MKQRCYNPKKPCFLRYGGRGITVCSRWLESFENFLADMGPRPVGTSLDRINNGGNYEPGNCRWATAKEQQRNTRYNVKITVGGITKSVTEWSELNNIPRAAIFQRLKLGWPVKKAVTTPTWTVTRWTRRAELERFKIDADIAI